jgi:hypothetical protein
VFFPPAPSSPFRSFPWLFRVLTPLVFLFSVALPLSVFLLSFSLSPAFFFLRLLGSALFFPSLLFFCLSPFAPPGFYLWFSYDFSPVPVVFFFCIPPLSEAFLWLL